jgi:chemotaxis protein CheD
MKREDETIRDEQPNRYFDPHFQVETAKILPGEYYATNKDMALVTVLGSCVSACLRDRETGIGGMNHFMLPDEGKLVGQHGNVSAGGRYGVHAMELLINQILKLGGRRDRLEAKVFGGGNVLQGFMLSNVGEQNANFIVEYLSVERIPIMARDLLDVWPRKITTSRAARGGQAPAQSEQRHHRCASVTTARSSPHALQGGRAFK